MRAGRVRAIAVFDFDGTLTRRDSLLPFLRAVAGYGGLAWAAFRSLPALAGYAAGSVPNGEAKEAVLSRVFGGMREDTFTQHCHAFASGDLPGLLRPDALRRIEDHRSRGDILALVSASLESYLKPWAYGHGFEIVEGTRMQVRSGVLTGRLEGPNCWGPEKVTRLRSALADLDRRVMVVYGDGKGDSDLMKLATIRRHRSLEPAF